MFNRFPGKDGVNVCKGYVNLKEAGSSIDSQLPEKAGNKDN